MNKLRNLMIGLFTAMACVALQGAAAGGLEVDKQAYLQLRAAELRAVDHPLYQQGGAPIEAHSFADLYRLTVSGALVAPPVPPEGSALRVAAMSAPRQDETRFIIGSSEAPQGWLLALTGFALAGWVAVRRLGYPQA